MENATTFGRQAAVYLSARPNYPADLFDWIAKHAPKQLLAWDVGTGSGQAALQLAEQFSRVHATDIDGLQLAQAPINQRISYLEAPAHVSQLPDKSVDAITVATALHWFDLDLFWAEVTRVARTDAIFCAWTYHSPKTHVDIQAALIDPIADILEPYWSDGNRLSWRGYSKSELRMPFEKLETPKFSCQLQWRPVQIAAFIRSWSAYQKARIDGNDEVLSEIEAAGLAKLDDKFWDFVLPLNLLAARIR